MSDTELFPKQIDIGELYKAAKALYDAGYWTCGAVGHDEQVTMWEALKKAMTP